MIYAIMRTGWKLDGKNMLFEETWKLDEDALPEGRQLKKF